jgi:hypothetical protein
MNDTSHGLIGFESSAVDRLDRSGGSVAESAGRRPGRRRLVGFAALGLGSIERPMERPPNKITGANSRPAWPFEAQGLRRRALVVGRHGRYHGGAAVAQFCRSA